ncbi:MAG: hypothetical protein Q8P61_02845 [Candidatus Nanopelagicales bacterium]|nr:hypothetical protein [Candidatus Nanopelagicales bacterium]
MTHGQRFAESKDPADQAWGELLDAAARLQELVPDLVLVGGTATALHAGHRYSRDADHVAADLQERFDRVLRMLEGVSGWSSNRRRGKVLVLGSLDGVDVGLRQLRRSRPLDSQEVTTPNGRTLVVPTAAEMLRIKGILVVARNATRDYLDAAAMCDVLGAEAAAREVAHMDDYYDADEFTGGLPVSIEEIRRFAEPIPTEADPQQVLDRMQGLAPAWRDWGNVVDKLQATAAIAAEHVLLEGDGE